MDKEYLLFDLDGTLTDPKIGITKSFQYALKAFDIYVADPDTLIPFIGPPLRDSFRKYYAISDNILEKAVEKYREYYAEIGIFENTLYNGIDTLLKRLFESGKQLILATSKPTVYAEKILIHFGIDRYFSFVAGCELDGGRSRKDSVIRYALDHLRVPAIHRAVMIGDREHDIMGAKQTGMDSIGVLYGYGDFDELSNAGAGHIVDSVGELSELLLPF